MKGKNTPTRLYEVVGTRTKPLLAQESSYSFMSVAQYALTSSTEAMQKTGSLAWNPLKQAIRKASKTLTSNSQTFAKAGDLTTATESSSNKPERSLDLSPPRRKTSKDPVGPEQVITPKTDNFVSRYETALKHYQDAHFIEARNLAKELLNERPDDKSVKFLRDRSCEYLDDDDQIVGLSKDELAKWSGVVTMHDK